MEGARGEEERGSRGGRKGTTGGRDGDEGNNKAGGNVQEKRKRSGRSKGDRRRRRRLTEGGNGEEKDGRNAGEGTGKVMLMRSEERQREHLSVVHFVANGLGETTFGLLMEEVRDAKLDVIMVSETKLWSMAGIEFLEEQEVFDVYRLDNQACEQDFRHARGGLMLLIRSEVGIKAKMVWATSGDNDMATWELSAEGWTEPVRISGVYRRPVEGGGVDRGAEREDRVEKQMDLIKEVVLRECCEGKRAIIVGDLNCHVGRTQEWGREGHPEDKRPGDADPAHQPNVSAERRRTGGRLIEALQTAGALIVNGRIEGTFCPTRQQVGQAPSSIDLTIIHESIWLEGQVKEETVRELSGKRLSSM